MHLFIGAYGSGKTETAINFALAERGRGEEVVLIDLDIVNPFFRSRDVREQLGAAGIKVISSAKGMEEADLPALSPMIPGALRSSKNDLIFDVGGDPVGARALARFHGQIEDRNPRVYFVVNPYRPGTGSTTEITAIGKELALAGRVKVTELVANPNLGPATDLDLIARGCDIVHAAAAEFKLPVSFVCVREDLAAAARAAGIGPILPIKRRMLLPWEETASRRGEEGDGSGKNSD